MKALQKIGALLMPKLQLVMRFFAAQGITLAGNMVFGLLCVRLLPASQYAMFVVVFAVQGTLVILMDVNFSGSLIPLIGERTHDLELIADYVASLRRLANQLFAVVGIGLIVAYPLLVKHRNWSWQIVAAMVATLLVSSYVIRVGTAYGAVLILLRDRGNWYKGQMVASLGSLALLIVCWALGWLNGFAAIWINVSGLVFTGVFYYRRAKSLLGFPGVASSEKRKSIVRLALPNVPQSIFYALQGQIPTFLITFLGRTSGIAGVGALGRLGQIFALLLQMNPLLVEPYFARLPKSRLKTNYLAAVAIAVTVCTLIAVVCSRFPELFLWVLGPTYSNLGYEVTLAITSSAISCFGSVLWFIHSARRFIYWWSNITSIVLIFAVQFFFILKMDVSTIRMVLWLNIATNLVSLLVNVLSGIYGFARGPREVEESLVPEEIEEAKSLFEAKEQEDETSASPSFPVSHGKEI